MKEDTQQDGELSLQPREKVLWESEGGPDRFDKVAWAFSLFWTFVFTVLTAILLTLFLDQSVVTGFSGLTLMILSGLLIAGTVLFTLSRHMYSDFTRDTEMNYAITNQRLVVANKSGTEHKSYTGRPFSSLNMSKRGDAHDITLTGLKADDPDEVVVQMLAVKDGESAEKLLLKSFMQKSGGKA